MVERFWYEGTIIRYNSIKERHKILYTDGDCEWMSLEQNSDRVQVMCTDGSWVMVRIETRCYSICYTINVFSLRNFCELYEQNALLLFHCLAPSLVRIIVLPLSSPSLTHLFCCARQLFLLFVILHATSYFSLC